MATNIIDAISAMENGKTLTVAKDASGNKIAHKVTLGTSSVSTEKQDLTYDSNIPIAGPTTLGGVKINGNNLAIAPDGTLSAASGGGGSGSLPIKIMNYNYYGWDMDVGDYWDLDALNLQHGDYVIQYNEPDIKTHRVKWNNAYYIIKDNGSNWQNLVLDNARFGVNLQNDELRLEGVFWCN